MGANDLLGQPEAQICHYHLRKKMVVSYPYPYPEIGVS